MTHFLHYSGLIARHTGAFVGDIFIGALGVTYIIRGAANIYYSQKNRKLVYELRENMQKIYEIKNIDAKQKAMQIKRLLEVHCTIQKDEKVDFLQTEAKILDTIEDDAMLYKYMKTLDQALHKKIVECEIIGSLGLALIVGGALTMLAITFSGGTAVLITILLSSAALLYVEETRSIYKTSAWFNNYQKELYEEPNWLMAPEGIKKGENPPQANSLIWYLSRIPTAIPRMIHFANKKVDKSHPLIDS